MKSNLLGGLNYQKFPLTLGASVFHNLVLQGIVTDGRAGGAILGRTYSEGGIYVVQQRGCDFLVHACVEGGEFVLNKDASCRNLARLKAMNSGLTMNEVVTPAAGALPVTHFIITSSEPDDKLLWLNWNQVVVASAPATKHFDELIDMNERANPFLMCDFADVFPSLDGTEDGIL